MQALEQENYDKFVELLVEAAEAAYEEAEPRSYSGRGMFGEHCLGITVDGPEQVIAQLCYKLGKEVGEGYIREDVAEDLMDRISRCKTDSMGRSTILYFPSIAWVEPETEDDEPAA